MRAKLFFILSVLVIQQLSAQNYSIQNFRAEDGLITDLIKCVEQDDEGFVWIGTDEGLFRYDGVSFTGYAGATSSRFIKDFLVTVDNRLLVIHDLGLDEIIASQDTVVFDNVISGSQRKNDGQLWYPKLAYEDNYQNLWIAEPQSIVLLKDNEFRRFDFEVEDNSASFVRSFHFVQLSSDSLLISSYTGNYYIYHYDTEKISKLNSPNISDQAYLLRKIGDKIYVGGGRDLYEFTITDNGLQLIPFDVGAIVTDLVPINKNQFLVCTEDDQSQLLYVGDDGSKELKTLPIDASINQAYQGDENVIWLSTLRGLFLLRASDFISLPLLNARTFIEGVFARQEDDRLYVLNKEFLWEIDKASGAVVQYINYPNGYFLTGAPVSDGIWISNEFSLWKYADGAVSYKEDFSEYGRYIFDLHAQSNDTLWFIQEATHGVRRYLPNSKVQESFLEEDSILFIAIGGKGDQMYFGTSDPDKYLYRYEKANDQLVNISNPLYLEGQETFLVNDILMINDSVALATDRGLWMHTPDSVYQIKLNNDLDRLPIITLEKKKHNLWIGSSIGLFKYDLKNGDYAQFNEKVGMPINSVVEEGIHVGKNKVWVGTTSGLAVSNMAGSSLEKTSTPIILNFKINNKDVDTYEVGRMPHQSLVEIMFSAMSFPANEIQYSHRLNDGPWTEPSFSNTCRLPALAAGSYTFELKARKLGKYSWSDPLVVSFEVDLPFYLTPVFYILLLLFISFIAFFSRLLTRKLMLRRQQVLRQLVNEKTSELNTYKENLEALVEERTSELQQTQSQLIQVEKMASLGTLTAGVAHEINNPVNYLQGGLYSLETLFDESKILQSDKELERTIGEVTDSMQTGVDRIAKIVSSLSQFSRNSHADKSFCDIHVILDNCLMLLTHELKTKCEVIKDYDDQLPRIFADESSLHQLFSNLVLNAVQSIEGEGTIEITTKLDGKDMTVMVKDDGSGIDPAHLSRLFDPFFTTKPPGKGTGLGLYIAHRVAETHNAVLDFEFSPGTGTKVVCIFTGIKLEGNDE